MDAGGTGTLACSRDASVDAGGASGLTSVCAEGIVMSGFGLRWDDGAHRISRWSVFAREAAAPDGCAPSALLRGANVVAELGGGPETLGPDAPGGEVDVTYHVVGAGGGGDLPDAGPPDGGGFPGLRMARGQTTILLDAADEGETLALFDLGLAGMSSAPAVAVVIDGLELRTNVAQSTLYPGDYDPADGYSTRGIGAWISGVERAGDDLRFMAGARFALGTRDRPEMDRATAVARTQAVVHWAVIALPVEPGRGTVSYRETHRAHGDATLAVCRPEPGTTALAIEGAPGLRAAPAIAGFRLRLFPDDAPEGDDVRELSIRVHDFAIDASGRATMRVEGYATNEGPPPPARAMDYEVEAEIVLLQWSATDPVEALRFVAPITTDRTELMLPLTSSEITARASAGRSAPRRSTC
jgi:hypothetical protein